MNVALKEWSAIVAALDAGRQIFLLRKGGIVESRRGFEPKYREFLLFPTFEHQHAQHLKPEFAELVHDPAAEVRITHLAQVTEVLAAPPSPAGMLPLDDLHIWNDDFIRQRYAYRPDLPIYFWWFAHSASTTRRPFHCAQHTPAANLGCTSRKKSKPRGPRRY